MGLFIYFLFLLLNWALLGMVMNMVGFGSPSLPAYDDWSGSAFSLCSFGGLALSCFC